MSTSDLFLLDSNILIYGHQSLSAFHGPARHLLDKGLMGQVSLCVCPQVLLEFFAVVTNSRRVTNPVTPKKAVAEVKKYLEAETFRKLQPGDGALMLVMDLMKRYPVNGPEVFDLHLVATMLVNGVTQLYTYNLDHFKKFTEIVATTP